MSYIVVFRNPRSKALAVMTDDKFDIVEFQSESSAMKAADSHPACKAWGYETVEVTTATSQRMTHGREG